jgi:hypothetical protein
MRATAIAALAVAVAVAVPFPALDARSIPRQASPHEIHEFDVAGCHFTLNYGRPSRRRGGVGDVRVIWGALVPWNHWWMPGADQASIIETSKPIAFGTLEVPAGQHTLYMLPAENESQLVISREVGQFHTQYHPAANLGQVKLDMKKVSPPVEQLTLAVVSTADAGGRLTLTWDDREYSAAFVVRHPDGVLEHRN